MYQDFRLWVPNWGGEIACLRSIFFLVSSGFYKPYFIQTKKMYFVWYKKFSNTRSRCILISYISFEEPIHFVSFTCGVQEWSKLRPDQLFMNNLQFMCSPTGLHHSMEGINCGIRICMNPSASIISSHGFLKIIAYVSMIHEESNQNMKIAAELKYESRQYTHLATPNITQFYAFILSRVNSCCSISS